MTTDKYNVTSFDTNPRSTLRFSSLLKFMQQSARTDCDSKGATYWAMRETGIVFVLVRSSVKLFRPVQCGEDITVTTWQHCIRGLSFFRDYEFFIDGELVGGASTQWVLIDYKTRKLCRPSALKWEIENVQRECCVSCNVLGPDREGYKRNVHGSVLYSMLDENAHLNNTVYLDIIVDHAEKQRDIREADLHYVNELKLGDTFTLEYDDREDGYSARMINSEGTTAFTARIGYFGD